jgi:hypothetical protein
LGSKDAWERVLFSPPEVGPEDEERPLPEPLEVPVSVGVLYDGLNPVVEAFHPAVRELQAHLVAGEPLGDPVLPFLVGCPGLPGLLGLAGHQLPRYEGDLPQRVRVGGLDLRVFEQVLERVPAFAEVGAQPEAPGHHLLVGDRLPGPLVGVPFRRDLGPAPEELLPVGFHEVVLRGPPLAALHDPGPYDVDRVGELDDDVEAVDRERGVGEEEAPDRVVFVVHVGHEPFHPGPLPVGDGVEVFLEVGLLAGSDDVDDPPRLEVEQDAAVLLVELAGEMDLVDAEDPRHPEPPHGREGLVEELDAPHGGAAVPLAYLGEGRVRREVGDHLVPLHRRHLPSRGDPLEVQGERPAAPPAAVDDPPEPEGVGGGPGPVAPDSAEIVAVDLDVGDRPAEGAFGVLPPELGSLVDEAVVGSDGPLGPGLELLRVEPKPRQKSVRIHVGLLSRTFPDKTIIEKGAFFFTPWLKSYWCSAKRTPIRFY